MPSRSTDPRKLKEECQCPPCIKKRINLTHAEPYKGLKSFLTKITLIGGWALLIFLAYKVSQFDYEMSNFDPYEILSIDFGASDAEIKKSYRKLSVIYHPDKETGDAKEFMRITKAYKALTDEEAKKNWDKYGNPDGPGAMSFGIALPSWIVEKENSVWVLGLYALVFMVALPTAVGTWWYRSIRFSGDKVLLDTTQMYFYFLHKTPQMAPKRAIMILAASLEFNKQHNSQVVERLSDNEEVPLVSHWSRKSIPEIFLTFFPFTPYFVVDKTVQQLKRKVQGAAPLSSVLDQSPGYYLRAFESHAPESGHVGERSTVYRPKVSLFNPGDGLLRQSTHHAGLRRTK